MKSEIYMTSISVNVFLLKRVIVILSRSSTLSVSSLAVLTISLTFFNRSENSSLLSEQ